MLYRLSYWGIIMFCEAKYDMRKLKEFSNVCTRYIQLTPTGIEPVLPPWKGDVLTAWPRSQIYKENIFPIIAKRVHYVPSKPILKIILFLSIDLAFDLLVTFSWMCYHTYTYVLSTLSSTRGLILSFGYLILRGASRLDAFSVYPVRTWLLCHRIGS